MTVDVHSHELAMPFMVFATQNPVEYEGTYPLPEAQVDRFMVRLSMGYPSSEDEASMLAGHEGGDRVLDLEPVVDHTDVLTAQDAARRVHASRALRDYIVALIRHTRDDARVELGRLAARGPHAAARGQGARARQRPRPRAARRRPGARGRGARRTGSCSCPRPRGSSARRSCATPSRPPRRSRERRRALRHRLRGARAPPAARRRDVRRRAALRDRRRAAPARRGRRGVDRPRRLGRDGGAHDRQAQRRRGGAAAGQDRGAAAGGCRCRPAGSTSRCCPSRCA